MRAALFAFALATLGSQAWARPNVVDLDRPGALDAVARDNPRHYREILEVTRVASEVSCDTGPRLLPVPVGAERMKCAALAIMTSDPPKRVVTFQLDDVRYRTIVTLKTPPGGFLPAR